MKRFLLKTMNVTTWIMTGSLMVTSLASLVIGVLPQDTTQPITSYLATSSQNLQAYGLGAFLTSVGGVFGLNAIKLLNLKLYQSNLALEVWETNTLSKINKQLQVYNQLDSTVVERLNELISVSQSNQKTSNAILGLNVITAQRNLSSNLVSEQIKVLYRNELKTLKTLNYDVKPITTVIEKTVEVYKAAEVIKRDRL